MQGGKFMSLFPFMKNQNEEQTNIKEANFKEYELNFETGKLTGRVLEGKEALKVWIYKALHTNRYRFTAYTWAFGCELEDLIGKNYSIGLLESEVERYIKECLLINEYIKDCTDFEITFEGDVLTISFLCETTFGELEVYHHI